MHTSYIQITQSQTSGLTSLSYILQLRHIMCVLVSGCKLGTLHTTHKTADKYVIFHTRYKYLSQLQQFHQQFYTLATILRRIFLEKNFAVLLCVMCRGF